MCRGGGGGGGLDADDESSLDALERGETNDPTAEVLTRLEQQNISKIMEVKKTLLEQQKTLMGVIHARSRELEAAARQKGFTSMPQDTAKVGITFKMILKTTSQFCIVWFITNCILSTHVIFFHPAGL